jgi:hypothetical protein
MIAAALLIAGGAAVQAQQDNWGQEVKSCNQSSCYPGGTSRGEYVRGQAKDSDGPGYAAEIHRLANPGKSDPHAEKFQ